MGRFMLGILTTLILFICIGLVLYTLDKVQIINLQKTTLTALSNVPGWEALPEQLDAGKKELKKWLEKEKTYQAQIDQLKDDGEKLQMELDQALAKIAKTSKTMDALEKEAKQEEVAVKAQNDALEAKTAQLISEMKPKAAAEYLTRIPAPVALGIIRKLEPRKAAKIMEAMPAENGSVLITMMAETL